LSFRFGKVAFFSRFLELVGADFLRDGSGNPATGHLVSNYQYELQNQGKTVLDLNSFQQFCFHSLCLNMPALNCILCEFETVLKTLLTQ
jgi:hypothetical protein